MLTKLGDYLYQETAISLTQENMLTKLGDYLYQETAIPLTQENLLLEAYLAKKGIG